MSGWAALVDAAVVGTGRAGVPPPAPVLAVLDDIGLDDTGLDDSGLEDTGVHDTGAEDAARLLSAAAAASRARRAGYQPQQAGDATTPEPAPADGRPEVSPAAARRLNDLLRADRSELVAEWLRLLGGTGCRPPDALVPALLTVAGTSRELRRAIAGLAGPLAAWLAVANPEWAWITARGPAGQPDPAAWPMSGHRERRELLGSLRRTDPAEARRLVLSTWAADTARDRAAFIAALATGLGPDDEELLERGLADSRGEVRIAAARLLARLPGSRFAARAATRAAAAVTVQRSVTGRKLVASAPDEATPDMIADCIEASAPPNTGRRAWLLRQVVGAASAAWWQARTGLTPRELLTLAAGTQWADAVTFGWTDAAVRDGDPAWIGALLERPRSGTERDLFGALRPGDRADWLRRHPDSPLFGALDLVPAPWPAGISDLVRDRLAGLARLDPRQAPEVRRLLRLAGLRLEPPAAPQLDPAQVHPRLLDSWADMLSTLSVRAAMHRELMEDPSP